MSGHSDETKAAAMAALLMGQSVSGVAKSFSLPKGTVSNWKKQAASDVAGVQSDRTQNTRERIGDLLLEYLEENIRSLKAQAKAFGDPAWLADQDASQLAVLHGVMTDKAVRLLEAMGSGGDT